MYTTLDLHTQGQANTESDRGIVFCTRGIFLQCTAGQMDCRGAEIPRSIVTKPSLNHNNILYMHVLVKAKYLHTAAQNTVFFFAKLLVSSLKSDVFSYL